MTTDSFATAASAPPRPFTADDIAANPEMVNRMIEKGMEWGLFTSRELEDSSAWNRVEELLTAALTEPPRPEGAEKDEWARDHLAAQEPSDAEVLAALNASMDPHGPPEPHLGRYAPRDVDEMRRAIAAALSARAALSAARRDEEKQ